MTFVNASITVQFPSVINNQFGYSGPRALLPEPVTDEVPDGIVNRAVQAKVKTLQQNPLIIQMTAGPIEAATTNEGSADAFVYGEINGNLENLTAAAITETFSFTISTTATTQIDMEGNDYADADILGTLLIGGTTKTFTDDSHNGSVASCVGFCGGNFSVTIPAHAVIPYDFSLQLDANVESYCSDDCSLSPETPEPSTMLLGAVGLSGMLWKLMRRD
jgi:hypothetical protein